MILSVVLSLALSVVAAPIQERAAASNVVGAYLLINPTDGPTKLAQVVAQAATLPINRVTLSFVRPDMYYIPGSNTLATVGFNYALTGDYGFAEVKAAVAKIQAAGVEVFLSVGGWDYNCWPYTYLRYSINPYGGPNAEVIQKYGNGNIDNCNASNQWCYACEPPSNGNTPDSFAIFPEPAWSSVWVQATKDVEAARAKQSGTMPAVKWHPEIYGGQTWIDPKTGKAEIVAGSHAFADVKRDPYQDLVYLAKDLGLAGIDLDYEEFWHADTFKTGDDKCAEPCRLDQTAYKYAAIVRDLQLSILSIYPSLKLSTAAAAVGAWKGNWWGGNMKGLSYYQNLIMPELTKFMTQGANAGGLNVMTYDISTAADECPEPGICSISQQVDYYMNTYLQMAGGNPAGIYVGYEIGTPAYPDVTKQPQLMANLTISEFAKLQTNTQNKYPGGFYWEMFKAPDSSANIDVNTVSQKLCNQLLPGQTRCAGSLPPISSGSATTTTAGASQTTAATTVKSTSGATTTTTTTTTKAPTTTTTVASNCYAAWSASETYNGGAQVSYNNVNYVANWWAGPNDLPGSSTGAWKSVGSCGAGATTTTTTTTTVPATTTTTTTTTKPATSTTVKPTTSTTTTTTTSAPATTATNSGGPVVGQPCTQGVSQCSAGTMYYCQGTKWILWYVGC